jgi:hypothetical protein
MQHPMLFRRFPHFQLKNFKNASPTIMKCRKLFISQDSDKFGSKKAGNLFSKGITEKISKEGRDVLVDVYIYIFFSTYITDSRTNKLLWFTTIITTKYL